jgi:predicted amidohydrolase YtcJ
MSEVVEIPWLFDRHSHPSLYAALAGCPDLSGCTEAEALALLRALPGDRISTVVGWHSSRIPLGPERLAELPPAILINFSLHGFALTAGALRRLPPEQAGLLEHQDDPVWCERNMERLLVFFGRSAGFTPAKLEAFMRRLQAAGIGAVEDMLLSGPEALAVIRDSPWRGRLRCWTTPAIYRTLAAPDQDQVAGLKLFTDGALGARTAAMSRPYLGGGDGMLTYSAAGLEVELAAAHPLGKPMAIHAIGERAVGQVLAALEHLAARQLTFPWVRMEHVQFITLAQARRAKALGVILSMQPNFNSDSEDYADRLPSRELAANNPFRMLLDQAGFHCGEDLIFGSDGMPHGVEYALQWSLFPPFPGQRLSVEELVAGFGLPPEGTGRSTLIVDRERRTVRLLHSAADGPAQERGRSC